MISRFQSLPLRDDVGALWENFCIVERIKRAEAGELSANRWFWRTRDQKEVDYIEEHGGELEGFEFKWDKDSYRSPVDFLRYPGSSVKLVNRHNYQDVLL